MKLLDGEMEEFITSSQHGITEITSIVSDLRTIVTSEIQSEEDVDLAQVGRHAASYFLQAYPSTSLHSEIQDVPFILGNSHRLLQAILNLLMNSVQAISTQGDAIQLRIFPRGSDLIVEVEDNGPSITNNLGMLFEPFYKARENGDTIGLGLAVVQTVVQQHGGTVACTSTETGRVVFRLTFPCAPVAIQAKSERSHP